MKRLDLSFSYISWNLSIKFFKNKHKFKIDGCDIIHSDGRVQQLKAMNFLSIIVIVLFMGYACSVAFYSGIVYTQHMQDGNDEILQIDM